MNDAFIPMNQAVLYESDSSDNLVLDGTEKQPSDEQDLANSGCRLGWPCMSFIARSKKIVTYPFLKITNYQDLYFVRALCIHRPYTHTGSEFTLAWNKVATACNEATKPDGELVFKTKVTPKKLKPRFKAYMDWIAPFNGKVPFKSGSDDEKSSEILHGIEDMYEEYKGLLDEKEQTDKVEAEKAEKKLKASEELRAAGLGIMQDNEKKRKASAGEKKQMVDNIFSKTEEAADRQKRLVLREENMKAKLALKAEMLKIKKKESAENLKSSRQTRKLLYNFFKETMEKNKKKQKKGKKSPACIESSDDDDDDGATSDSSTSST